MQEDDRDHLPIVHFSDDRKVVIVDHGKMKPHQITARLLGPLTKRFPKPILKPDVLPAICRGAIQSMEEEKTISEDHIYGLLVAMEPIALTTRIYPNQQTIMESLCRSNANDA